MNTCSESGTITSPMAVTRDTPPVTTHPSSVVILPPIGTPPPLSATALLQMGGTDKVDPTDVDAKLVEATLTVTLKNLGSLGKGNYYGTVYFGGTVNRVAALVNLLIS